MKWLCHLSTTTHAAVFLSDLPPLEVELTAPFITTAGDELTVVCSVTNTVPHLITLPQIELIAVGDIALANSTDTVLATGTGYSVSETLNPVTTLDAGQEYVCRAELNIESIDLSFRAQSDPHTLTVRSKSSLVTTSPTSNIPTSLSNHV